jgi:hypothetical protein
LHWVFVTAGVIASKKKSKFLSCQMPAAPKADAPDGPVEGETRNSPPAASCGRGVFEVADDAMAAGTGRATSSFFLVED